MEVIQHQLTLCFSQSLHDCLLLFFINFGHDELESFKILKDEFPLSAADWSNFHKFLERLGRVWDVDWFMFLLELGFKWHQIYYLNINKILINLCQVIIIIHQTSYHHYSPEPFLFSDCELIESGLRVNLSLEDHIFVLEEGKLKGGEDWAVEPYWVLYISKHFISISFFSFLEWWKMPSVGHSFLIWQGDVYMWFQMFIKCSS